MKKFWGVLILGFVMLFADVNPECGVFSNVLQTRATNSAIDCNSGSGYIYDSPSCTLNTPEIEQSTNGGNALHCGNGLANASGVPGKSLNINYDFNTETVSVTKTPTTSTTDVDVKYDWTKRRCTNTDLKYDEYNKITQDSQGCDFRLSSNGDKKINKFDQVFHTITFDNLNGHTLEIGQFITKSYESTNLIFNGIPTTIKINKLDIENDFSMNMQASDEIDMEELDIKGTSSDIVLKAPKIVINSIEFGNPSWGKKQILKIYADDIDIKNIDFGENTEVYIYPYTSGKNVTFHADNLATSSKSKFLVSSGDYYIGESILVHDSSNGQVIGAIDENQVVNLYTKGLDLGSESALNADGIGEENFGDNPAANFRIFIDGDLKTGGGGCTINALIYVEDDVEFGSPTYVRGAVSSYGDIKIGNGSKFYWDDSIDNSGFGECPTFQNIYSCGIFDTVLTSYKEILSQHNGVYNTCKISVKDYNLNEDTKNPITCYDQNNNVCKCDPTKEHCSINETCTIIDAPKNKLNYDVYQTIINDSYVIDKDWQNQDGGKAEVTGQNTKLIVTFKDLYYGSYTLTQDVSEIHFEPQNTYSDDPNKKLMILGDFDINGNSQTVYFDGGDYYFNSFKIDKDTNGNINQISICAKDDVRIFIKNDFVYSGNHLNDAGCGGKIFIYVEGNSEIDANGGGNGTIPIFIYTKGSTTIENSGDATTWIGAITSEGEINITGQNVNFVYDSSASDFGYGSCPLCYALNNNGSWVSKFTFFNSNVTFNLPREMAIINDSTTNETLYNLVVTQNETNPSFFSVSSPICYQVVDQDKSVVSTDINATETYTIDYGIGSLSGSVQNSSNNGNVCITPSVSTLTGIVDITSEINTTALFGDYAPTGYEQYYAIDTYGIQGTFNGSENLNYYATYLDSQNRFYSIKLDYCNVPDSVLTPKVSGSLDAWDTDHNETDRNITTKIVNQEFNLTLAFLGDEATKPITVKYSLFDDSNNRVIYSWRDFNIQSREINTSFSVDKAYRNVRVIFDACADYNGTDYKFYPYETCTDRCENNDEVNHVCLRYFKSSDNFAIRPYGFMVFGNNEYKRAGEEFNLTIKAVNEGNYSLTSGNFNSIAGVENYGMDLSDLNITADFYSPSDSEVLQMYNDTYHSNETSCQPYMRDLVALCPDLGTFEIINGNDTFNNGEANATLKYTETGVLSLTVSEKPGREFAIVDADDTPAAQRYIKPAQIIRDVNDINKTDLLMFIPYKIVISGGDYNTTTDTNWTYVSNDVNQSNQLFVTPKMAAVIYYKIQAQNKDGNIVRNFTKTCFPDTDEAHAPRKNGLKLNTTFDLFLDATLQVNNLDTAKKVDFYTEDKNHNPVWVLSKEMNMNNGSYSIREWIGPTSFENGEGEAYVYFNIEKEYNAPHNPAYIKVVDINTSTSWMNNPGATHVFEGLVLNKNIEFRYGSIFTNNMEVHDSNEANLTVKFMYYDNNNWKLNTQHNGAEFGEVNLTKTIKPSDITLNVVPQSGKNVYEGEEKINVRTTHALPYSAKIHLSIPSWLWYHPLAKPYLDPSPNNLDCLTHPCVKVTFSKSGKGWAGIGRNDVKYSENNVTVEVNITRETNVSKQGVKKLNW